MCCDNVIDGVMREYDGLVHGRRVDEDQCWALLGFVSSGCRGCVMIMYQRKNKRVLEGVLGRRVDEDQCWAL